MQDPAASGSLENMLAIGMTRGSILALVLVAGCGDDDAGPGDTGAGSATGQPTGTGGTAGLLSCSDAMTADACATAKGGSCEWKTSYFLPADGSTCVLGEPLGGACVDYSTVDGCDLGPCGSPGSEYELFYRSVEGGYEVVRASDCNPMLDGFAACPIMASEPFFCACMCSPQAGDSGG